MVAVMSRWKSILCRYGMALLFSFAAVLLILPFDEDLGGLSPFFVCYAAVALSSWLGGTGPGLLATAASAAAGDFLLVQPQHSLRIADPTDVARLLLFVMVGCLITGLNGALRTARHYWKLEAAAARRSENRLRRLEQSNLIGVFFSGLNGRVTDGNEEFLRLLGCTREDLEAGRVNWQEVTVPEHRPRDEQAVEELHRCGVCTPFEKDHVLRDGRRIPVLMGCASVDQDADECIGFLLDLTERKRAESEAVAYREQLRARDSEAMLAEERERRRIATVLHDSVGQRLAVAQHKLRSLSADGGVCDGPLAQACELLAEAASYTRTLTSEISPPVLYELGLVPALQWLADRTAERHGIVCGFQGEAVRVPLSDEARLVAFHAVRELLFNVVKHARARSCQVCVSREEDALTIVVRDDGVGFPPGRSGWASEALLSPRRGGDGFGLFNIRERLHHVGGALSIRPAQGGGTEVAMTVPLAKERSITDERRKQQGEGPDRG